MFVLCFGLVVVVFIYIIIIFIYIFFFLGGGGQELLLLLLFRFDWLKGGGGQKGTSHYVVQFLPSLNLQLLMCQCLPNMC